jgi:hypothetical protein
MDLIRELTRADVYFRLKEVYDDKMAGKLREVLTYLLF